MYAVPSKSTPSTTYSHSCITPTRTESARKKNRQIIVKFATWNIRERVFSAITDLKDYNKANNGQPDIYTNEGLAQFRANLAKKARDCKKNKRKIADTWNIESIRTDICKGPS